MNLLLEQVAVVAEEQGPRGSGAAPTRGGLKMNALFMEPSVLIVGLRFDGRSSEKPSLSSFATRPVSVIPDRQMPGASRLRRRRPGRRLFQAVEQLGVELALLGRPGGTPRGRGRRRRNGRCSGSHWGSAILQSPGDWGVVFQHLVPVRGDQPDQYVEEEGTASTGCRTLGHGVRVRQTGCRGPPCRGARCGMRSHHVQQRRQTRTAWGAGRRAHRAPCSPRPS